MYNISILHAKIMDGWFPIVYTPDFFIIFIIQDELPHEWPEIKRNINIKLNGSFNFLITTYQKANQIIEPSKKSHGDKNKK